MKLSKSKLTGWILSGLLALFLIGASAMGKFTEWEGKSAMFKKMGFTTDLMFKIGIVEVIKEAYPDPSDKTGKFVCVDIKADKPLKTPVTMTAIKADKKLADMALVKYSRLSVQPVTAEEWKMVCKMGGM